MSFKKCERFANVTDLAWNPKVSHIIAAASDSGVVSIIDLRSKKEVTTICLPNFDRVSSISWNPESVKLVLFISEFNSIALFSRLALRLQQVRIHKHVCIYGI